jgi:hypothetical protein
VPPNQSKLLLAYRLLLLFEDTRDEVEAERGSRTSSSKSQSFQADDVELSGEDGEGEGCRLVIESQQGLRWWR